MVPQAPSDLLEISTLDELRRLQNKKTNWRFSIALLIISAAFFILNSRESNRTTDWEFICVIVGVLLFHELGHYLAMKIFGYRNLKMFFIPGFGAAVSGRHYNAPAWKKIIVSLMGPLPGIFVGTVLLIFYVAFHNELLYRISIFAIAINAFNLIPVLPFDGGWVAHAALFSRKPKLDVSFRLVAALLIIGIGIKLPGALPLMYVGIAALLTLPTANKLAIIVAELRTVPGLGVSPDSQTIPTQAARVILAKVRQRYKRNLNARLAAQRIASIFESLNARPPSFGATFGLISLHIGGFVLALLVGFAALATHGIDLLHLRSPMAQSQYVVTPDQLEIHQPITTGPRNVLIARFKTIPAAKDIFNSLPPDLSADRYGQTLLMSFPPDQITQQREIFSRYEKKAADIFVETGKWHAGVQLTFTLPNTSTAQQAFDQLELYLMQANWGLIPPWATSLDWPTAQRASQYQLRHLLKELQTPEQTDPESFKQRWQQIAAARRTGDSVEVDRLEAQAKQEADDAQHLHQQNLQAKYGHPDFIQKWAEITASKDFTKQQTRLKQELAPQLGIWPPEKSKDLLASSGYAANSKLAPTIIYCQFNQTDTGLIAITQWLFSNGITDIHYTITAPQAMDTPDDY